MKGAVVLFLVVVALACLSVAEVSRSPVCKSHVACISAVLKSSHICVGEMLCKQVCEDLNIVIAAALDTPFYWEKHCGAFADSARFALRSAASTLVPNLASASGCGEQACSARLRVGQVSAVCENDDLFMQTLADAICFNRHVVPLDELVERHQKRGVDAVLAHTPEGSIGMVSPTSPTTLVITAGRKAGDIIGFIVLCALIIACVIPMSILFLRWVFLTIKNFDSQAFMARFGK